MDYNFLVENIIIKLDNGNNLVLKVSLKDWIQPFAKNIFNIETYYKDYIENTLNNCVDNESVKYLDKIDYKKLNDTIKKEGWKKEYVDFKIKEKYDYIINNMLCVNSSIDKLNGMYRISVRIPTRNYDDIEDKISFEVRDSQNCNIQSISEFIGLVEMSYGKSDEYKIDCFGTYLRILKYESGVIILCDLYDNDRASVAIFRSCDNDRYVFYLQCMIHQYTKKSEILKHTIEQVTQIGTSTYLLEEELQRTLKELLYYELIKYIEEDTDFLSCNDEKSRRKYLYNVLQRPEITKISSEIKGGKNLYIKTYKNNELTYMGSSLFNFLDKTIYDKIREFEET